MTDLKMSPDEAGLDVTLWETGRSVPSDAPEDDMPLIVVWTSACAELSVTLTAAQLKGDIRYLYASSRDGDARDIQPFDSAAPTSVAAMRDVGLVFIAVDPKVDSDLTVAYEVSRAARDAGVFVVAVVAQAGASASDVHTVEAGLLRAFDSLIIVRGGGIRAQSLACTVIGHIAGGLKVAPPVCTDLADVQAILSGAIVSVGVGDALRAGIAREADRACDATKRAMRDVGYSKIATATGALVVIAGDYSVRLSEISRVTHQVGDLVRADDATVVPTVHLQPVTRDDFRVILLIAHRPVADDAGNQAALLNRDH
ncbi:FtsZ/tubulin family protein [Paraburkholderia dilworthii]|uniref:hypothetical protein n=1 Tax=Paraburkholderia dilworthii TaxID=948106 RepID=UPI0003F575BD|nr:hypothetical protein [Paraburkholderia dilworthii]